VAQPYYVYSTNFGMGKMSVSIYSKGDYKDFHVLRRQKNKANSKPNKANRQLLDRYLNQIGNRCGMIKSKVRLKRCDLKKQSQFVRCGNERKFSNDR